MAGLYARGTTRISEPVVSRDHTERMFRLFGIPLRVTGRTVSLEGPVRDFRGRRLLVPGDISSAAFFLVAGLIVPGAHLLLRNVGINPTRTGLLDVLKAMGARVRVRRRTVPPGSEPVADLAVEHSRLRGVVAGGAVVPRMIDEFPILAVAATQAEGVTVVKDAAELRVKESDRIASMEANLRRMGADITATKDGWIVRGPSHLKGGVYDSFGDHRVAMSMAVAALVADGPVTILDTRNVATSFPNFSRLLRKMQTGLISTAERETAK
jgi:3-phosphoshikimate 1-carboxyvinyltransferase